MYNNRIRRNFSRTFYYYLLIIFSLSFTIIRSLFSACWYTFLTDEDLKRTKNICTIASDHSLPTELFYIDYIKL